MWFKDEEVAKAREEGRRLEVDGERWLVYELSGAYDRRGPSLIFESEQAVRRVREYPVRWRALSDVELAALRDNL